MQRLPRNRDSQVPDAFEEKRKPLGVRISAWVSDLAANPLAQLGVIAFCALWWALRLPTDILTAALSILAITLTQMVLNRQNEREQDSYRRDVAMHVKLDELLVASKVARSELAGIEDLEQEEIDSLKDEIRQAIEDEGEAAGDAEQRATAKDAASEAVDEVIEEAIDERAEEMRNDYDDGQGPTRP